MTPGQRGFLDLFADISRHGRSLVKAEMELFAAELASNGSSLATTGLMAAVAGGAMLIAFMFIVLGIMLMLIDAGFHASTAAFVVGGGCLLFSLLVALIARSRMNGMSLVPRRTIAQIQLDAAMLERSLRNG